MTIVPVEKEVSLKSLRLFSKTIVRQYCSFKLEKKTFNTYKWKEKVQKNSGSKRKLKLRKLPSKDLVALFSSRRAACLVLKHNRVSEVFKGFKVHDFEYLLRSKKLHFEIEFISLEMCQICDRCSLRIFCPAGSVTRIAFKYKLTGFRINFFKNDFSVYYCVCLFITVGQSTVARQLHKHHLGE